MSRSVLAAMAAAFVASFAVASASAQMKVGVVLSATGATSVPGIPQANTVPLLPKQIGGVSVEYLFHDDASDTTQSVQQVTKFLKEDKVDAIIGPTASPNVMAVIGAVAEAGVPLLAPTGADSVVLPMDAKKRWIFKTTQNDDILATALIRHMADNGKKRIAIIATNDPTGESFSKTFKRLAEPRGITVVVSETYARVDRSTVGQCLRINAAQPDAVLVAAPGASAVLPAVTLRDQGYRGQIYEMAGAASNDFLKLGGKKVEGIVLAASKMLVIDEIPDSDPVKPVTLRYMAAYKQQNGEYPATFGANVYDAGILLAATVPQALKAGRPGTAEFRSALRDSLEHVKEVAGAQGVYTITPEDHSGFNERDVVLIVVRDGTWRLLSTAK